MVSAEEIWNNARIQIRGQLNENLFNLWFGSIKPLTADDHCLVLGVPDSMHLFWIEDNYKQIVRNAVITAAGEAMNFKLEISPLAATTAPGAQKSNPAPATTAPASIDDLFSSMGEPEPRKSAPRNLREGAAARENPLNVEYTFTTFVEGEGNRFARAAAIGVAKAPATTYNPLFIHGGVGLGKTHLMHAIGNAILDKRPHAKVVYITSEKFVNEFIDAMQNNTLVKFRKKYRSADVLLIDDIQFFAGKDRSQEEFFHTFNSLKDGHKQIVLTCDRPASEVANLEKRLISRFEWGMSAEMNIPDTETREAIIRRKAQLHHIQLPDMIFRFLAERIQSNIRRLEGALIRLGVHSSLNNNTPLTVESVEVLLKDLLEKEQKKTVTIDIIQKKVAERFDVRVADLTSKKRPAHIAFPRQIAMYLSRELTQVSLSEIGDLFGGRDHGTVIHACKTIKDRMDQDGEIRQSVQSLMYKLERE